MPLESTTDVDGLVVTNPDGENDPKGEGDDHLRMIKGVLKTAFPSLTGALYKKLEKAADYTVLRTDNYSLFDCSGTVVLNLTAAATLLNDHNFFFYVRSGSIQINPNGAELINGVADIVFTAGAWGWVFCDGTGFTVMSNANLPAEVIFTSNIADESVTYAKLSPALATDLPTVTIVAEDNLFILDASDANLPKKGLASDIAVPAGAIVDFARTTAPSGYLALPVSPSNVSRTTYARLFAAIGITWGAGDGSTTFGLPYCPENYAMLAANGNVGAVTTGDVKAHTHTAQGQVAGALYGQDTGYQIGAVNTGSTGGAANLAAGVKVLKCIKL